PSRRRRPTVWRSRWEREDWAPDESACGYALPMARSMVRITPTYKQNPRRRLKFSSLGAPDDATRVGRRSFERRGGGGGPSRSPRAVASVGLATPRARPSARGRPRSDTRAG